MERTPRLDYLGARFRHRHTPKEPLVTFLFRMPPTFAKTLEEVTSKCQRWRERKVRYRPPGEVFNPSRAEVVVLPERDAKAFIETHHYSKSYPAARFRVGLLVKPALGAEYLGGVAVYSVPMTQQVIPSVLEGLNPKEGVELGRLVLLDSKELVSNAESWFVARAHRLLRATFPQLKGVVAYCDPLERRDESGQLVKRSHTGVVYRALGCLLRGTSSPRTLWLTPDGQVASERALSKLRAGDQGREYAEQMLRERGAPRRGLNETPVSWLERLKAESFLRPMRHPGNLRFAWDWRGKA
jgi:hypothetical protein